MQFYFDESLGGRTKTRVLCMGHGSYDVLFWEMKKLSWNETTFRDINRFFAFLDEDVQEKIFLAYRNIRDKLDNAYEFNTTSRLVNEDVIELYRFIPLALIEHWMRHYSDIRLPPDLKTTLLEDDRPEQTYLEPDYRQLTYMSIALKAMVPVWTEFLAMESAMAESNKEIYALQLLRRTEIMESQPMERFREFVDAVVAGTTPGMKNIIFGIGSADIPEWMLAYLVVSRLSVIQLSHNDDDDQIETVNLISKMWSAIKTQLPSDGGRSGKDEVRPKTMVKDSGGEEDNLSTAESYKVRESISDGERIAFDYWAHELRNKASRILGDDYDRGLLVSVISRNNARKFFNPIECQLKLVAVTLHQHSVTRALPHTDRTGAIGLISIAQVYLHQNGFSVLADLIGATQKGRIQTIFNAGQIKEEQLNVFNEIYPYRRYTTLGTARSKASLKTPGEIAVNAFYNEFANNYWQRDIVDVIAEKSTMIEDGDRGMMVPPNFKQLLAEFIIFINTRSVIAKP
ncbi:hypothetical protein MOC16_gp339 [Klebsiella phage vB_KpM_FBKp24]|uniref:Uncharacterized protein n=1 Tax=Klebsiella phage vB_KpM_FBKp24 TaxID=2801834 RepID=A0A7U0J6M0_9CAUD|nr:hypothetical protein [Klebsiella pneumoniae]YP_010298711.1 hypothetical protein MOC16_gp339 [Klebsiella phage vB_KpM_FBKp24]QQV92036.1 hypothetical protein vBKpMFBKp24_074 [Klebsiella phage vB_KpM_FBKp24]